MKELPPVLEGGQPQKPVISIFSCGDTALEREVLAGIEEEGVPSSIDRRGGETHSDAYSLAVEASRFSPLDVGIGIGRSGEICVHYEKFTTAIDGLSYAAGDGNRVIARIAGHNAARLVIGIPLRKGRS